MSTESFCRNFKLQESNTNEFVKEVTTTSKSVLPIDFQSQLVMHKNNREFFNNLRKVPGADTIANSCPD